MVIFIKTLMVLTEFDISKQYISLNKKSHFQKLSSLDLLLFTRRNI